VIATGTPEDFEHFVQSETARWSAVIRQSNIVVD
jgi:hypothetical protein